MATKRHGPGPDRRTVDRRSGVVERVADAIALVGKTLIGTGVLILAFVAFQLWGTGLAEARAQDSMRAEFVDRLAAARAIDRTDADAATDLGDRPEPVDLRPAPLLGDPIGVIEIPSIGVSKTMVEGTNRDVLRSGPGHYAGTPLPGLPGNTAIAGHRTTNGAPFFDLDLLVPGDEIVVETLHGSFTYVVEAHDDGAGNDVGHFIVDPAEVSVITDQGDNRLTLTACHPKYSAEQRIIVTATLVSEPLVPPDGPEVAAYAAPLTDTGPEATMLATETFPGPEAGSGSGSAAIDVTDSLGWQPQYVGATVFWAALTAAVAALGVVTSRRWYRGPAYAMTLPPFGLALFLCFTNLDRLLPAV